LHIDFFASIHQVSKVGEEASVESVQPDVQLIKHTWTTFHGSVPLITLNKEIPRDV